MSRYRKLTTICAAAALAFGLAACGGGGGGGTPPLKLTSDDATKGTSLTAGTYDLDAALAAAFGNVSQDDLDALDREYATGETVTVAGYVLTCSAGPCTVTVNDDDSISTTGTIGVMAYVPEPPPTPLQVAQGNLSAAEAALAALSADASDASHLAAQQAVHMAAQAVAAALRAVDAPVSDVEAADAKIAAAAMEIAAIQKRIDIADGRMKAIDDAKAALTSAQGAQGDTPTAAEYQAVADAAGDVVTALESNGGSESDIATYMGVQALAQAWANYVTADDGVAALDDASTDEEMRDAHQARADAADALLSMDSVTDPGEVQTLATAKANSENAVTAANKRIADAADDAANKQRLASNAASELVATAIGKHDTAGNPGFASANTNVGTAGYAKISRGSGAAKIALNQTATVAAKNKYASGTAQSAGTGWAGATFTRSSTSGKWPATEMAAIYTDIEMAKDQTWNTAFAAQNPDSTTGAVSIVDLDADRVGSGILGTQITQTAKAGTFFGVSGAFTCSDNNGCVATKGTDGKIDVTGGTLTFAPTIPTGKTIAAVMAKYADPDGNYTSFGYWMKSTSYRNGVEHDIETFHGGTGALLNTGNIGDKSGNELVGSAKYYGVAAGLYVKRDGAGDSLVVTDGTFTADAMLAADFGGDKIAEDDQYEVSGSISNFMDGATDLGFDKLVLERAPITSAGAVTGGSTNGGGETGAWDAQFYGTANTDTTPTTDDYPTDVSGEFNGHFVNGSVAGAFGAEKD